MQFRPTRRRFVTGAGALAAVSLIPLPRRGAAWGAEGDLITLRPGPGRAALLETDGPKTPIWGYDGRVPGPPIVVSKGDEVRVRLINGLTQPTTIHWHGVRIDNAMDGVPHLTQEPVAPGASFEYRFRVPDAGVFWYHPHEMASEQLGRGMYGPLIVQEETPPEADQDLLVLLDDWRLERDGTISESFGNMHDAAHAGRLGNVLTVNGEGQFNIHARARERVRLRLFNVANARVMGLRFADHQPIVVALDGQPVAPYEARNATIVLAPGQRADVFIDMVHLPGKSAPIVVVVDDQEIEIGKIGYHAYDLAHEAPLAPVSPLPANLPGTPFAAGEARRVEIVMEGGAMGRFTGGTYKGKQYDPRGLVEQGQVWTFNGVAGMADKPLFAAKRGEPVIILFRNGTAWPHAMHLHGHHFREIGRDGAVSAVWRDTIMVDADEDLAVALTADNPGKWLIHCHMIEHHAAGMATWFTVEG